MRGTTSIAVAALAMGSFAQAATVYLAGDSTMAKNGAGDGSTDGWGQYLGKYLTLSVVNNAIGGRSARSFTREGRFASIAASVKSGDFVIIEFGHNDGGSLSPTDNGRTDCPGAGSETCQTTYNGVAETVLTFNAYIQNAAKLMQSKGATVIVSSQTPNNPCEGGPCSATPGRFSTYAHDSAAATGSGYIDHWTYVYNMDVKIGTTATNAFYPNDHTHTSPAGADAYAQAFVKGLTCSSLSLKSYVNSAGNAVNVGNCIGGSTPTTTAKPTTTTKATTTANPTGGTAAHYAQCGGIGYTGPTVCISPYVCTYSNDYYSQCL